MLIGIFSILILTIPCLAEWYGDRNGDKHPNNDWVVRVIIMVLCSVIVDLINPAKNFAQAFVLAFGLFVFIFPYGINIIHYTRKIINNYRWWDHLSKSAIPDKWEQWSGLHWSVRMIMQGILLTGCIITYNCWGKIFSYYNICVC